MNRVVFHDIQTHFGFETGIKTDLFETYNYGNFSAKVLKSCERIGLPGD